MSEECALRAGGGAVSRPRPVPSPTTQPFWDATAEQRFLIQRCRACGQRPVLSPADVHDVRRPRRSTGSRPAARPRCTRSPSPGGPRTRRSTATEPLRRRHRRARRGPAGHRQRRRLRRRRRARRHAARADLGRAGRRRLPPPALGADVSPGLCGWPVGGSGSRPMIAADAERPPGRRPGRTARHLFALTLGAGVLLCLVFLARGDIAAARSTARTRPLGVGRRGGRRGDHQRRAVRRRAPRAAARRRRTDGCRGDDRADVRQRRHRGVGAGGRRRGHRLHLPGVPARRRRRRRGDLGLVRQRRPHARRARRPRSRRHRTGVTQRDVGRARTGRRGGGVRGAGGLRAAATDDPPSADRPRPPRGAPAAAPLDDRRVGGRRGDRGPLRIRSDRPRRRCWRPSPSSC